MPQLMPLIWYCSSYMCLLLFMMLIEMYFYEKLMSVNILDLNNNFMICYYKW